MMKFETLKDIKEMMTNNVITNALLTNKVYSVNLGRLILDIGPVIGEVFNVQMAIGGYWPRRKDKLYIEPSYCDVDPSKRNSTIPQLKFFKKTPIWLTYTVKRDRNGSDVSMYVLNTINKDIHKKHLSEFIEVLTLLGEKHRIERSKDLVTLVSSEDGKRIIEKEMRTFDDVYLDDEMEESIKANIDNFIKNRQWFIEHKIPHHFGFLLYGPPSSGKSVLAQAIAHYADARLFKINGDDILKLPSLMGVDIPANSRSDTDRNVILIEDIDCGFTSGLETIIGKSVFNYENVNNDDERKNSSHDRKIGMAALLNCLDGMDAPDNTIYVMTTNHVNKLDPALIRPGRIDAKYEITYINRCQFDKFCMNFYGKKSDESFEIKDGLTIASLQIEVMNGCTFDQLVDKVRK